MSAPSAGDARIIDSETSARLVVERDVALVRVAELEAELAALDIIRIVITFGLVAAALMWLVTGSTGFAAILLIVAISIAVVFTLGAINDKVDRRAEPVAQAVADKRPS